MSYHPNNLKHQPYDHEKLIELAEHAERLGIQFKVAGIPFGASYDRKLWDKFYGKSGSESSPLAVCASGSVETGFVVGFDTGEKGTAGSIEAGPSKTPAG